MASSRQEARESRIISNAKPFIETQRATSPVLQSQASSRKHTRAYPIVSEPTRNPRRDRFAPARFIKRLDLHDSGRDTCRDFQLSAQGIHDSTQSREANLAYPDFETNPHPALLRSVKLSLRTREIDCLEYQASANPPILHRKETFLAPDHPLHAKFARLTEQEEKHGLLDDTATIGTRDGWHTRLNAAGFALRGHRLVRS